MPSVLTWPGDAVVSTHLTLCVRNHGRKSQCNEGADTAIQEVGLVVTMEGGLGEQAQEED